MRLRTLFFLLGLLLILAWSILLFFTLNTKSMLLYVGEGVISFSLIVLFYFYRKVVKPLNSIASGMDLLREQDFSSRLASVGQAEADRIVEMFNRMMDQLKNERLRLREQNHFLDLLINVSPMGVIILTFDEQISMLNAAALLGFYDVFKKKSLANNAVLPVLGLNTLFSSLIFLPFILVSYFHPEALQDTLFYVPSAGWEVHKFIILKSFIVLSSWTFGYFGMKHLPLTIVGPINATRPVMTLVGALLIFGERLNVYQWIGVLMAIISFFMLSRSGKKEGIDFKHDKWIWFVVLAAVLGAVSGLYDKYLMGRFNNMVVQAWYNVYQLFLMGGVLMFLWWPKRKSSTPFHWDWCIILISVFLSAADFVYFYALGMDGAMISIVSMVRRGSVVVSFLFGAMIFREKNLKSKVVDLILVLIGMFFLYLGNVLG